MIRSERSPWSDQAWKQPRAQVSRVCDRGVTHWASSSELDDGLSTEVFNTTFEAMRLVDPERLLYVAYAHRENHASLRAGRRMGLLQFHLKDDHYWILLGEVPDGSDAK